MTAAVAVAADTNLIRHPTPRRYLTSIEGMRGRRVAILPMVDAELEGNLPMQAATYIQRLCRSDRIAGPDNVDRAAGAAARAAAEWWDQERLRNTSTYTHLHDLGKQEYVRRSAVLPEAAFTDDNDSDRQIYAQAWAHGIDVLASRNRNTILRDRLEAHFTERGLQAPPVTVKGLLDHTAAIAREERRTVSDVALEAVLGAVIPGRWTQAKSRDVLVSCQIFADNLAVSEGRGAARQPEENELVLHLRQAFREIRMDDFTALCERTSAQLPEMARSTEARYHDAVRTAVRGTGIDLWG